MVSSLLSGELALVRREETSQFRELEAIYRRTWPDVFRYALVLTHRREEAEDIASETYRRALEALATGRSPGADVLPWLLTITRRLAIDRARRGRLIGWLSLDSTVDAADTAAEEAYRKSEVWIWFEQLCRVLPPRQREALYLRFGSDLSDEAAALVIGTSVGNVRTRVSRGLAALRAREEATER